MQKKYFLTLLLLIILKAFIQAQCPSVTVTPISQTLTCNGAPVSFTAAFNPTLNVTAQWLNPGGTTAAIISTTSPVPLIVACPGIYTFLATNNTSSCSTTQTILVTGSPNIPSFTINASSGTTVSCSTPSLAFYPSPSSGPAPKTFSWTNVTTSITTTPVSWSYTATAPGYYITTFLDGNGCRVSQTVSITGIICTAIDKLADFNKILIFPNPVSNTLYIVNGEINIETTDMEVTNTLGQTVLKLPYSNTINVSSLSQGYYNLKIMSKSKPSYNFKFIKE